MIDINLTSVFVTMRECAERMIDSDYRVGSAWFPPRGRWEQPALDKILDQVPIGRQV